MGKIGKFLKRVVAPVATAALGLALFAAPAGATINTVESSVKFEKPAKGLVLELSSNATTQSGNFKNMAHASHSSHSSHSSHCSHRSG